MTSRIPLLVASDTGINPKYGILQNIFETLKKSL